MADDEWIYSSFRDAWKTCMVPTCPHNDIRNPHMKFVYVRKEVKVKWCELLKRNCPQRGLYCCERHLNFEEDLENYSKWVRGWAKPRLSINATLKNIPETPIKVKNVPEKNSTKPPSKYCKPTPSFSNTIEEVTPTNLEEETVKSVGYNIATLLPDNNNHQSRKRGNPHKFIDPKYIKKKKLDKVVETLSSLSTEQSTTHNESGSKQVDLKIDSYTHNPNVEIANKSTIEPGFLTKKGTNEEKETTTILVDLEQTQQSDFNDANISENRESESNEDTSNITMEQFEKACELYLSPEIANYVKAQIKQPV